MKININNTAQKHAQVISIEQTQLKKIKN